MAKSRIMKKKKCSIDNNTSCTSGDMQAFVSHLHHFHCLKTGCQTTDAVWYVGSRLHMLIINPQFLDN